MLTPGQRFRNKAVVSDPKSTKESSRSAELGCPCAQSALRGSSLPSLGSQARTSGDRAGVGGLEWIRSPREGHAKVLLRPVAGAPARQRAIWGGPPKTGLSKDRAHPASGLLQPCTL